MSKWYEGWHYQYQYNKSEKLYEVYVDLPNSRTAKNMYFSFKDRDTALNLAGLIFACFDQIQQDNGGYKTDSEKKATK